MIRGKYIFYLIIGLLLSGITIFISFRNVPFAEIVGYIVNINPWYIILSAIMGLSTLLLRTFRWQAILLPVKRMGFWNTYHPLAIAFSLNCILPGRMGEFARPFILLKRENLKFSRILATVVVERIFDIFTLLILFVCIIGSLEINYSTALEFHGYQINQCTLRSIRSKALLTGLILTVAIAMLMMAKARRFITQSTSRISWLLFFLSGHSRERISRNISNKIQEFLDNVAAGFEILKMPTEIIRCMILSIIIWIVGFMSLYLLILGSSVTTISFLQASAIVIFICFFIMLPSVPGYWGLWEVAGIYGLMLFGINKAEAAGIILVHHTLQVLPLILLGMLSVWIIGIDAINTGLYMADGHATELDKGNTPSNNYRSLD